ncbi:MAG TPA: aspartate aminotransferase family protein [Candidatus Sulfopaludibacter sp.]|jgi:ornithine--oxo-acid transaminase|nr:aspartate aminotransferase family protein [Candidatus Sulfopaludibacter sp.]
MSSAIRAVPVLDRVYADHVNPQWVRLLNLLQMNVRYESCHGAELFTADGRRILDFLSGYCVHNTGHNHPAIVEALKDELTRNGPAMVQSHVPELAAELAHRLSSLAGGGLERVFFTNSGSEGVEAAIKFARAHTGRAGILAAENAFHGLTCGALSLMSDAHWREGFGPLLADSHTVPFGSLDALEKQLSRKTFAAFIVEPIQAEGGIRVPAPEYLQAAQQLCRRYGTLFVLDEVQTGMWRTGEFLAAHRFGVQPDMVVLAKALSGGLVPVGALLSTRAVSDSVFNSMRRAFVHASTFGENSLAMRAGLATIDVLEKGSLGLRARVMGAELRRQLSEALAPYEMVKAVRGEGLLCGIEFTAPKALRLRVAFEAFRRIHPAMFGQILVMRLFRDHDILTQICGNDFMVLKAAPPLLVEESQLYHFVSAVRSVVDLAHTSTAFWAEALGLARRAANI